MTVVTFIAHKSKSRTIGLACTTGDHRTMLDRRLPDPPLISFVKPGQPSWLALCRRCPSGEGGGRSASRHGSAWSASVSRAPGCPPASAAPRERPTCPVGRGQRGTRASPRPSRRERQAVHFRSCNFMKREIFRLLHK